MPHREKHDDKKHCPNEDGGVSTFDESGGNSPPPPPPKTPPKPSDG